MTPYEIYFITTELCENGKLFDYIITDIYSMMHHEGKMKDHLARRLFMDILEAVKFLHINGVCHRNIKLENIVITSDFRVKLCDFSFTAQYIGKNAQKLVEICGTPLYMGPEFY